MTIAHRKIAALGLAVGGILIWPAYAGNSGNAPFCPPSYITPTASELTYTVPDESGVTPGIPYSWVVTLGREDQTNFGFFVGALSWYQPTFSPPNVGWTHNSNWVALTLTSATMVTIVITPNVPVPCKTTTEPAACDSTGRTGSDLWPAISIYQGQDTTSVTADPHTFNPTGPFWATGLTYLDSSYKSDPRTHTLTYTKYLSAGKFTINIGGAAAKLPYLCSSTAPCYSGGKSYQAFITTTTKQNW
jgi:hypothetical protein